MLIELHAHTHHSHGTKVLYDGTSSPAEMVRQAAYIGLGALAITDHNHMHGVREAVQAGRKYNIIVIPGEEVSSSHGHVLGLGIAEPVAAGMAIEDTVDAIHAQGGIAVSSHPFDIKHEGLRERAALCDAMEIFNANNLDRLSNRRARRFAAHHRVPGTAGSDAHHASMIGHGLIAADAHDIDGILRALQHGSFTTHARYPAMRTVLDMALTRLRMSYDYTANYIETHYSFPKRNVARGMLGLVRHERMHPLFASMAYVSLGGVIAYSAAQQLVRR